MIGKLEERPRLAFITFQILLVSIGFFVVASAGIFLTREAGNVAMLWPANALLLGVLLRAQSGHRVGYIIGCAIANWLSGLAAGDSFIVSLGYVVCNFAEILVAFVLLQRFIPKRWNLFRTRHVLIFGVVAAIIAPIVGAVMGATLMNFVYGTPFYEVAKTWWVADGMGFLLVAPAILTWDQSAAMRMVRKRGAEMMAIAAATLTLTAYAFTQPHFAVLYSVVPLLLWTAFRLDTFGTAVASLLVCSIAIGATAFGNGPISEMASDSIVERVRFLQLFLGVAVLAPLVVAIMVEERQRLMGELARKNAELERFTYTVSHDLKAPLITLQGFLSHLRSDLDAGSQADVDEDISELEKASNNMSKLLQDLLSLSKQGVVVNRSETFSLVGVVDNVLETTPDNMVISIQAPDNLPLIRGDRDRISSVLQNIFDNAQKFSINGKTTEVHVTIECRARDILCRISDNGIGIPHEQIKTVFELFERLNPDISGSGVGLPIAKRIVEAHGGDIWIESEGLNHGSTVGFTLPHDDAASFVQDRSDGQHHVLRTAG